MVMEARHLTTTDKFISHVDQVVRTLFGRPTPTERVNPADAIAEPSLTDAERTASARLMRVNHAGEVAAQALYQGQALTARLPRVRSSMERAALEENDHLLWCEQRIGELGSHASYLNPLWHAGSLTIGACAGLAGDKWSLGFVAETENQVVAHLQEHLGRLPEKDTRSRAILEQMREDERRHGDTARDAGGIALPAPIKALMTLTSKIMTRTAYWL